MDKTYKKGLQITVGLALLLGLTFTVTQWKGTQAESPHYVDLACGVCHASNPATCSTSPQCEDCHHMDRMTYWTQLKAPELTLCTSCHDKEGDARVVKDGEVVLVSIGNSHPWGVVPGLENSPATLPLTPDGKMTCLTCHDVHNDNEESHMLRIYERFQIPDTDPPEYRTDFAPLCKDCHDEY